MDENCTVGQGLACHFNTALCTLHGFNVVCAAGLVLSSREIVLGHRGWKCSASWEGGSLFKLSLWIQLSAGEWHSAGLVAEHMSLGCMSLGGFCSSSPQFHPDQVFQVLAVPRLPLRAQGTVALGITQPPSSKLTTAWFCCCARCAPPPGAAFAAECSQIEILALFLLQTASLEQVLSTEHRSGLGSPCSSHLGHLNPYLLL